MAGCHPAALTGSGCRVCDLNNIVRATPHTTYLVLPPPKSSASSTTGVSIGMEQAEVSEEGDARGARMRTAVGLSIRVTTLITLILAHENKF